MKREKKREEEREERRRGREREREREKGQTREKRALTKKQPEQGAGAWCGGGFRLMFI